MYIFFKKREADEMQTLTIRPKSKFNKTNTNLAEIIYFSTHLSINYVLKNGLFMRNQLKEFYLCLLFYFMIAIFIYY